MGHGQSGGKGRRVSGGPPPRRRPDDADAGPTITEKIAARKRAGGAESWDDYKAKMKERQKEQFAADNHEVLMSAQHREVLDREREARLKGTQPDPPAKRHKSDKVKKRKKDKHKKDKKHKKKKHKKAKSSDRDRHGEESSSSSAEEDAGGKASEPVKLSEFLANDSD